MLFTDAVIPRAVVTHGRHGLDEHKKARPMRRMRLVIAVKTPREWLQTKTKKASPRMTGRIDTGGQIAPQEKSPP